MSESDYPDSYTAIEEFAKRFEIADDESRLKVLREGGATALPDSSLRLAIQTLARAIAMPR